MLKKIILEWVQTTFSQNFLIGDDEQALLQYSMIVTTSQQRFIRAKGFKIRSFREILRGIT